MREGIAAIAFLAVLTSCGGPAENMAPDQQAVQGASRTSTNSMSIAEQREMETRNKAKIEEMKAAVKTLGDRDYEARLTFWKEISALAPANTSYAEEVRRAAAEAARHDYVRPEDGASIEMLRPHKAASGNVLVIDVTIRNDSLSHLKDFQMVCENKGNSGTTTDTKRRVLYEIVEARTSRTFRDINMGLIDNQAAKTDCRIASASVA